MLNFGKNITQALSTPKTITYPLSYTSIPSVVCCNSKSYGSDASINTSGNTISSFNAHGRGSGNTYIADNFHWISIGY
ncbi:MAG: hypothetical protein IJ272_04460 [Clostridia bacterium]|nr:hypothetical protein [Clostridia bacterium]